MAEILTTVPSGSNPNKTYDIIKGGDGVIYCTCTAWKMSKNCKHLKAYHANECLEVIPQTATEVALKDNAKVMVMKPSIKDLIAREVAFLKGNR